MDGNQEIPAGKEVFSTAKQTIALQARLILGGEALNPDKLDLKKVNDENLEDISKQTFDRLNIASTNERSQYWQEKSQGDASLNSYEVQMKSWVSDVVKFVNQENFTEKEAMDMYNTYFIGEDKISAIDRYVISIVNELNQLKQLKIDVNLDEILEQGLPEMKKMANIFGANSSELIEASIRAKLQILDEGKKTEFISQVNEEVVVSQTPQTRLDYLNPVEDRLLRWLDQNAQTDIKISKHESSPKHVVLENLTTELAKKDPELFKKTLLEKIKRENPKMYSIWELLCKNNRTSADKLIINPDTWFSESDNKDGITLGTASMDKDSKYAIIFDDAKLNYEDEVIYRFAHEMSHKLVYHLVETKNQKSEFNYLLTTLYNLRSQPDNRGFSSLGSLGLYKSKGPQIQAQEDLTEMVNMYIQDPEYLKRFFNFLSDEKYLEIRNKYGLAQLSPDAVDVLFSTIERGLKPLDDELNIENQKLRQAQQHQNELIEQKWREINQFPAREIDLGETQAGNKLKINLGVPNITNEKEKENLEKKGYAVLEYPNTPFVYIANQLLIESDDRSKTISNLADVCVISAHGIRLQDGVWRFINGQPVYDTVSAFNKYARLNNLPQIEFITACDNEAPNQMKIVGLDTGLGPIIQSHLKPTRGVTSYNKKLGQIYTTVSGNFHMPESLSSWKKEYKHKPID
ncbi:MAG: hypothetical protein WCT22_00265 [Patescibacteria group bacterium]